MTLELPTSDDRATAEGDEEMDLSQVKQRIQDVVAVLNDFRRQRQHGKSRKDYLSVMQRDVCTYYGYLPELAELFMGLFSPAEALQFFEANEEQRPVTIRTNTLKTTRRRLAQALIARGVSLDPVGDWTKVGLKIHNSRVPLGATPEYLAGHYMLQSSASFLPVMALDPQPGERVLDMAASPGGKTTHIAQMMGNKGLLMANDIRKDRVPALAGNLSRLGVQIGIVTNYDGRAFPKVTGGFNRVLLDAPCSGLGVIAKDPAVKLSRSVHDISITAHLQKELLCAAVDSVDVSGSGRIIVYSTCSVSVQENEEVIDYILKKRCVKLVPTGLSFGVHGFTRFKAKRYHPSLNLTRRFYPHVHNTDGFYVAKLYKYANGSPDRGTAAGDDGSEEQESGFVRSESEPEDSDVENGDVPHAIAPSRKEKRKRANGKAKEKKDEPKRRKSLLLVGAQTSSEDEEDDHDQQQKERGENEIARRKRHRKSKTARSENRSTDKKSDGEKTTTTTTTKKKKKKKKSKKKKKTKKEGL
eukprot:g1456.t1